MVFWALRLIDLLSLDWIACFRGFWFTGLLIVLFLFVVFICVLIIVMSVF